MNAKTKEFDEVIYHHASEALEPQPPVNWTVEGLLTVPSLTVLCGNGGSFKTFTALDLAVCVATGQKWLDFPTKAGAVLIVDEESGTQRMLRRLGDCLRGHFLTDADIWFSSLSGFNFFTESAPEWANRLRLAIQGLNVKLVVIDALVDIMLTGDENRVSDVQLVLYTLRGIADQLGASILLLHHTNKNGAYRGSSALRGAVDLLLTVEAKDKLLTFSTDKARDIEPVNFAARCHFAQGQFWLSSEVASNSYAQALSKSERYVLEYLQDSARTVGDIMSHASCCSEGAARAAVYRLSEKGLIKRMDGGGRGEAALYGLAGGVEVVAL